MEGSHVVAWIEEHLYYLVLSGILLYFAYPILKDKLTQPGNLSPQKMQIYRAEAAKIREKQQAALNAASEVYQKNQEELKIKKTKEKKTQNLGKLASNYNPMDPTANGRTRYATGTHGNFSNRRRKGG